MIIPARSIGTIVADVVVEEHHEDRTTITRHPVEGSTGVATISDNAVDEPSEVTLTYGWWPGSTQNSGTATITVTLPDGTPQTMTGSFSNPNFLNAVYAQLLDLRSGHVPFMVYTGRRVYANMLISMLSVTTDKDTENALIIRVVCQQLIIVTTTTFQLSQNPAQVQDPQTGLQVAQQGQQNVTATPLPSTAAFQNSLSAQAAAQFPFPGEP
jgi:hypothetical protein